MCRKPGTLLMGQFCWFVVCCFLTIIRSPIVVQSHHNPHYKPPSHQFLTGSKIQSSPYHIYMLLEDFCHVLCQKTLSKSDASSLQEVISQEYHNHWIIDNLPSAMIVNSDNLMYTEYAGGFPIGFVGTDKVTDLFNHVKILIEYHQVVPDEEVRTTNTKEEGEQGGRKLYKKRERREYEAKNNVVVGIGGGVVIAECITVCAGTFSRLGRFVHRSEKQTTPSVNPLLNF